MRVEVSLIQIHWPDVLKLAALDPSRAGGEGRIFTLQRLDACFFIRTDHMNSLFVQFGGLFKKKILCCDIYIFPKLSLKENRPSTIH